MGYTTEFAGKFWINHPLTAEHKLYLSTFSETRRMKRDPKKLPKDPVRKAVGLPAGEEGGYFVGATGFMGQDNDKSVLDYNTPPKGQPGLWCQWVPNENGTAIVWNMAEKFYEYVEWLEYLNDHFLKPWGYMLDGSVRWQGEDTNDTGTIVANEGVISKHEQECIVKSKRVGYGGMTKRVLKEKRTITLVENDPYAVIHAVCTALEEMGKSSLIEEYRMRINGTEYPEFLKITKEYVVIQ